MVWYPKGYKKRASHFKLDWGFQGNAGDFNPKILWHKSGGSPSNRKAGMVTEGQRERIESWELPGVTAGHMQE